MDDFVEVNQLVNERYKELEKKLAFDMKLSCKSSPLSIVLIKLWGKSLSDNVIAVNFIAVFFQYIQLCTTYR